MKEKQESLLNRANLLLVSLGLKPSSEFYTKFPDLFNGNKPEGRSLAKEYFNSKNIKHYCVTENHKRWYWSESEDLFGEKEVLLQFAASKDCLEKLVKATVKYNPTKRAQALGYPQSAIKAYSGLRENINTTSHIFRVKLCDAHKKGVAIPEWIGYISFVPPITDIENGIFCQESAEIGTKYREAIRKADFELSCDIDKLTPKNIPLSYTFDEFGVPHFVFPK